MILIPSIELRRGAVVALPASGSAAGELEVLAQDPIEVARGLRDAGALFFHVLDVDGLLGEEPQLDVVAALVDAGLPCEVAGGITNIECAERLLDAGADRIVVDPGMLSGSGMAELVDRLGARLAAGLEIAAGTSVRAIGRVGEEGTAMADAISALEASGIQRVVCRALDADGRADVACLRSVLPRLHAEVLVSAPVRTKADLEALTPLVDDGAAGVVLEGAARRLLERAAAE